MKSATGLSTCDLLLLYLKKLKKSQSTGDH
jgi:hypothetical protein